MSRAQDHTHGYTSLYLHKPPGLLHFTLGGFGTCHHVGFGRTAGLGDADWTFCISAHSVCQCCGEPGLVEGPVVLSMYATLDNL